MSKRRAVEKEGTPTVPEDFGDSVIVQFFDGQKNGLGDELTLPVHATKEELTTLLKSYLPEEDQTEEFSLILSDTGQEIRGTLGEAFAASLKDDPTAISTENTIGISYYSLAPFKVRPVTRLSSSLSGHAGTVLCLSFSPDGSMLATGSGDCEVRLWDLFTATPIVSLKGHTRPVECLAWAADCKTLATGSEDKTIRVWDASTAGCGKQAKCTILSHHRHTITALSFMPAHLHDHWISGAPPLLSASRDGCIRKWNVVRGAVDTCLDGHTAMVSAVAWSGLLKGTFDGKEEAGPFVYSASRDMSVRVWRARDGVLLRCIRSHGHWVNAMSSNTAAVMRYGAYDPRQTLVISNVEEMVAKAKENWKAAMKNFGVERVVTCSDDNCLNLWNLLEHDKPIAQMHGHQKAVCSVAFSPNGRFVASAGFDSAVRLWDGRTGKYLHVYRGHVGPVYQVCWSSDSRLLVSGSRDSTLKCWNAVAQVRKLQEDLPGHADEIYALDWSPTGHHVASGGKDKIVRIWSH